ncbi:MAG: hypothetical protein IPK85_00570 [Gemmatimonadetes bacterium]|nr:hypothetical protein [Gemmatimonadota bacterium]
MASPAVSWSSSNVAVATVNGSGGSATIASVAPGTSTITATSAGVSGAMTVTVQPPPSVSLSVPAVSVSQGSTSSTDVTIARINYSGPVTVILQNLPPGITGSLGAARPGPNGAELRTLTLSVVATVPPGAYSVTLVATGQGVSSATLTAAVTVIQATTALVTFTFCAGGDPVWFAARDDRGVWSRVTGTNGNYVFPVGLVGGVAWVNTSTNVRQDALAIEHGPPAGQGQPSRRPESDPRARTHPVVQRGQ